MEWDEGEFEASPFEFGNVTAADLRASQIKTPDCWLANFIYPGSLTLIHAAPGTGKTPFTMQLVNAAMGYNNLFNWRKELTHKAASCYYMDGELPLHLLKRNLLANFHKDAEVTFFNMAKLYKKGIHGFDLSDAYWMDALRLELDKRKPDILVLDNRSNFFKGEENSNDDAIKFNDYLVELREDGPAIILDHHQGKMGQSRGASAIKDIMDNVIRLDWVEPDENISQDHFKFAVKFEKVRAGYHRDFNVGPSGFEVTAKIQLTGGIMMFNN